MLYSEEPEEKKVRKLPELAPAGTPPSEEACKWAMAAHLAALAMFTTIPFANVIGPFVIYTLKRDDDPFIMHNAKESLNFQLTMSLVAIVLFILYIALLLGAFAAHGGALPLWWKVAFAWLVAIDVVALIMAALQARKGVAYEYSTSIRFIQ